MNKRDVTIAPIGDDKTQVNLFFYDDLDLRFVHTMPRFSRDFFDIIFNWIDKGQVPESAQHIN